MVISPDGVLQVVWHQGSPDVAEWLLCQCIICERFSREIRWKLSHGKLKRKL
jgi:hypothetical protein